MTLQQPPGDGAAPTPDGRYPPAFNHHPSPVALQGAPPQHVTGYVVAGPSGGHPGVLPGQHIPLPALASTYPSAGAFPAPLLPPHAYVPQSVQQVGRLVRTYAAGASL